MSEPKRLRLPRQYALMALISSVIPIEGVTDDTVDFVLAEDYDALSARLAAVEKERDEAVALLRDIHRGAHGSSVRFPCEDCQVEDFLARRADAARPEQEK